MGRDGDRRQIRRKNDAPAGRIQPYGTSPPERLQRARGGVSTALPLRSTRPEAGGGGISLRPSRRLDQSLAPEAARRDLHGIGVPERTPHSRTAPARPGRGLDFTSFRSTRPGGEGEGYAPRTKHPPSEPHVMSTGGSTAESRSGDISTDPASPNGSSIPERLRHARGGVSTSRRSARHDQGAGGGGTPHKTQHLPQTNTSSRLRFRYARHDLKRAGEGVSSSMRRR